MICGSTDDGLADEAEIDDLLDIGVRIADAALEPLGPHQIGVLAGDADRLAAFGVDGGDDLLIDRAGQHHLDHVDRLAVGDAQATLELRADIEPLEQRADLWAAAMHHDRVHAGLLDHHDVAGEALGELGIAHGVAAIFHHHRGAVVALHEGQRLGQDLGLGVGRGEDFGHACRVARRFGVTGDGFALLTVTLIAGRGLAAQRR